MLQTSKALRIFPELLARSGASTETKSLGISDFPCESHTLNGENVIIIRPDKTSPVYESIREKRTTSLCQICGWEICK